MSFPGKLPTDVVLPLGATAEKSTCGSCQHFSRRPDEWGYLGRCTLKLPPQFATKPGDGEGRPVNSVSDRDTCDMWADCGKTFIVSRRVP